MNRGKNTQTPKAQHQHQGTSSQKKKRSSSSSSSSSSSKTLLCGSTCKPGVTADAQPAVRSKPGGNKVTLDATSTTTSTECALNQRIERKLSDGSVNTSDSDLSKDSGCACSSPSPKSDESPDTSGSSDVSDCPSSSPDKQLNDESLLGHNDPETSGLIWTDGRAYSLDRSTQGGGGGIRGQGVGDRSSDAAGGDEGFLGFRGGGLGGFVGVLGTSSSSSMGTYLDPAGGGGGGGLMMMMDETTEDLVREIEDLRSENEYLKDEMEELRCEMVETRDMFHQEEVETLQALTLQVEQANKTCRILQYRLRKAERRSIRVAQTGHVDGELVRSLEHDIKVAKCVSVRVHGELEAVQEKTSRLEEENQALREKMEELAVSKMVLQAEMDKSRESSLKRRGVRSPSSKAERRLSQHMEDDSADLKLQLHLAKEELALMVKKLSRLVSESEAMRQELAAYRSAYGDVDHAHGHAHEGRAASSALAREAEVKVHLRLVEEEATLLSRRIVELEVENRGLRAEMREEEEEEEEEEVVGAGADHLSPSSSSSSGQRRETEDGGRGLTTQRGREEASLQSQQSEDGPKGGTLAVCQIPREGPVGGERDPADCQESEADRRQSGGGPRGNGMMTAKDRETLLALRDHSCIVSSAVRVLLTTTSPQDHPQHLCSALWSAKEAETPAFLQGSLKEAETPAFLQGSLKDALELLQTMLLDFTGRMETLVTGGTSLQKDGHVWDSNIVSPVRGEDAGETTETAGKPASAEDLLHAAEGKKERAQQGEWSLIHSHTFQILWVLHQWGEMKASGLEGTEVRDKTMTVLRSLLEELGADMDSYAKVPQSTMTECAVNTIFDEGKHCEADRSYSSKGKGRSRPYAAYGSNLWWKRKNWVYVSQEAAQADTEDPVRTWDHPVMALSFPELDFEQMQANRSHTAPETTAARVYYSPPSARRVRTAHGHNKLRNISPAPMVTADTDSVTSASASWCTPPSPPSWATPPSSLSALCLGLSSNLSDDMKEITAGFSPGLRQPLHSTSMERRRARGLDVSCSATQTHMMQPQMVSVGLQTDAPQRSSAAPRALLSARSTSSLERLRPKPSSSSSSSSSPKLYRRHSTSLSTSLLTTSPSTAGASRERGSWNSGVTGPGGGGLNTGGVLKGDGRTNATKPPSKAAASGGRYGLVTEFLRRVSGRAADKTPGGAAAAGGSKSGGFKHLERSPSRTPPGGQAATPHRNDSVTRIVNQRFMKQREDRASGQREDRANSGQQNHGNGQSQNHTATRGTVTRNHSSGSVAAEDGSHESSSSRTLSFCFARPSRSAQRQQASQCKTPQRHRTATSLTGTKDPCSG